MARLKNIMQNISSIQDTIDRNYSFSIDYLLEIKRNSKNELDVITNIFNLGYLQGMKAEQAKRRKDVSNSKNQIITNQGAKDID